MQDTVDPAAAPPRTLAQIIEDARRAVCGPLPLQKEARGGHSERIANADAWAHWGGRCQPCRATQHRPDQRRVHLLGVTGLNAAIFADPQGVLVAFVARPRRATRIEHTNEIGLLN
jgi:hypothetical protein